MARTRNEKRRGFGVLTAIICLMVLSIVYGSVRYWGVYQGKTAVEKIALAVLATASESSDTAIHKTIIKRVNAETTVGNLDESHVSLIRGKDSAYIMCDIGYPAVVSHFGFLHEFMVRFRVKRNL